MKNLCVLLLFAGMVVSCTTSPDPAIAEAAAAEAAEKAKGEANVALAEEFMTAFESGDAEAWKALCTEDFVTWGPGVEDKMNLEEYMEMIVGLHEQVDSMKFNTLAILPYTVEEGDLAGDYVFWWGSQSGYFGEQEKSVELSLHTVYGIENGKITWTNDYWDTGDLDRQLSDEEK